MNTKPTTTALARTTLAAGGLAGTLLMAIAPLVPEQYRSIVHYAAPWVATLAAVLWPNAWERFRWRRRRHQALATTDEIINRLNRYHVQTTSPVVRKSIIRQIHQLESERARIAGARPFMDVDIDMHEPPPSELPAKPNQEGVRTRDPSHGNESRVPTLHDAFGNDAELEALAVEEQRRLEARERVL